MDLRHFSSSEGFFDCSEPLAQPGIADFDSLRGRGLALRNFFAKLCLVPFAFLYKIYRTAVSCLAVGLSIFLLVLTLCGSQKAREFFIRRVSNFSQEIADWVLWPIAVVFCLMRLLMASVLHPALYFKI